ncbi:uncharacterized protein LOC114291007 [Camellia sinensis]|uniref:uncharacterized protein LOC114291007 n=1 Tax=Camellia sinensis TaxID=4442 RepID=UPI0010362086|nr:uncharacterized protein LOC114291007 [Camellia sinensis]
MEYITMIKTLHRILEALSTVDNDQPSSLAAVALKEKRLTFTWLNGEAQQIIKWISQIIEDGDSRELPFFRAKTLALVPEDADPIWSVGAKTILSKGTGMKQRIGSIMNGIRNRLGDPRIGPVLLLGALMSFGGIWLRRSQSTHPSQSNNQTQPSKKDDEDRPNQRRKKRAVSNQDCPPSITDTEPKDAYQMPLSDSDSE